MPPSCLPKFVREGVQVWKCKSVDFGDRVESRAVAGVARAPWFGGCHGVTTGTKCIIFSFDAIFMYHK